MKNGRITALLIAVVSVLAIFCGCAQKELTYTALELGRVSDGMDQGKHTSDIPEWSYEKCNPHRDAKAPAEMTVTFNGKTYTGSYDGSFTWMPNAFVSHCYKVDTEEDRIIDFRINSQTGELTFISIYNKNKQGTPVEEAQCRKIADAVADDYISLKDYYVIVDNNNDISYTYTYYRSVSGHRTTDMVQIVVHSDGMVSSCDVSMAGAFKNVKKLSIDEEKATSVIEAKLQDIYGHLDTMSGYTIKKVQWVKTADDRCGRLYTMDVQFKTGSALSSSIVELLII